MRRSSTAGVRTVASPRPRICWTGSATDCELLARPPAFGFRGKAAHVRGSVSGNTLSALLDSLRSTIQTHWGRPGFDAGSDAVQGMPRSSHLVKPSGKLQTPITSVLLSPLNPGETLL